MKNALAKFNIGRAFFALDITCFKVFNEIKRKYKLINVGGKHYGHIHIFGRSCATDHWCYRIISL